MTAADPSSWRSAADAVLTHYALDVTHIAHITQGLVNLTLKVTTRDGRHYALQRLHPVFGAGVNHNIEAVCAHLAARGMLTPQLVRTRDDALAVEHAGGRWRVMTWVEGRAFDFLDTPAQAQAAGELLARFHAALVDFPHALRIERAPIHDFARHRARLDAALGVAGDHRLGGEVRVACDDIDALRGAHAAPAATAPRLVHGDPKISNLLFDAAGTHALCLVDLDTLAPMALPLELGDAMRSWCNPRREDDPLARFELPLFTAAMHGYGRVARAFVSAGEIAAMVPATLEIHLELAVRFLVDALEESYFGWDASRYDSRGAHNLARARGQLAAAGSLIAQLDAAQEAVVHAFA
ncbi:MAG: phosphotransferase [Proteobacteria bacterium]|nr:phosphotransferase [Pseudomonadota bacterium]